jgi:hypothetical protein
VHLAVANVRWTESESVNDECASDHSHLLPAAVHLPPMMLRRPLENPRHLVTPSTSFSMRSTPSPAPFSFLSLPRD